MDSQLSFHIKLPFSEIEASLNKHLEMLMYEGTSESAQPSMSLRVIREGKINVYAKEEILVIETKVHVWVKTHRQRGILDLWKDLPGISVEETDFNILVRFYMQLHLQPNWHLSSKTVGNFEWERKPKLGLGLLNISIAKLVAPTLQAQITRIGHQIDTFIQTEINVPMRVHAIWDVASTPYQLHDYWESYLLLLSGRPQIYSSTLKWEPSQLSLYLVAEHAPSVFIQNTFPSFQVDKVPNFHIQEIEDYSFTKANIHIKPQVLTYYLTGKSFNLNEYSNLLIEKLSVKIIEQKWHIHLCLKIILKWRQFEKEFDLHSQLIFRPKLGDKQQWIILDEMEYSLETSPLLLKWWNKYSEESLRKQILSELNKWLQDIQSIVTTSGNELLNGTTIHPNAELKGQLLEIKAEEISQTKNFLILTLRLYLRTQIELHNF